MATALYSLLEHNKHLGRIFLISNESSADRDLLVTTIWEDFGKELEVIHVEEPKLRLVYTSGHVTEAAYLRFLLGDVLPLALSTVLYLDSDLVIMGELTAVLPPEFLISAKETDSRGWPLIWAVSEHGQEHLAEAGLAGKGYFNSGVMAINLLRWRKSGSGEKLFAAEEKHRDALKWWDQDVFNIALSGDWEEMSPLLNGTVGNRHTESRIIHFNSHRKPWMIGSNRSDWNLYRHYRAKTPFPLPKQEFKLLAVVKNLAPNWVLNSYKKFSRSK